jgi:hypothetical protein
MGRLQMLDETGDTTISWSEDRDEEMAAIIQKKMDEGMTFFIVERHGSRGPKLERPADAMRHRALAIPDEDLRKFVEAGAGTPEAAPAGRVAKSRVSRDAKEVAGSDAVGTKARRGG